MVSDIILGAMEHSGYKKENSIIGRFPVVNDAVIGSDSYSWIDDMLECHLEFVDWDNVNSWTSS